MESIVLKMEWDINKVVCFIHIRARVVSLFVEGAMGAEPRGGSADRLLHLLQVWPAGFIRLSLALFPPPHRQAAGRLPVGLRSICFGSVAFRCVHHRLGRVC